VSIGITCGISRVFWKNPLFLSVLLWRIAMMECLIWSIGIMEYSNDGDQNRDFGIME
jgi:hypothetical protein